MGEPRDLEAVVADELRRAIALDGRSLNAVGRAAGFSQGYLSQLLRGRQDLKVRHVARVLGALEVSPEVFCGRVARAIRASGGGASAEAGLSELALREAVKEAVREELSAGRRAGLGDAARSAPGGPPSGPGASTLEAGGEGHRDLAELLRGASLDPGRRQALLARYGPSLGRKAALILAEDGAVPGLMAELLRLGPEARRKAVRSDTRYRLLALAEALRQESRSEGFRDVARAVELAELSAEVAECLDPELYGRHLVADARGMAWAMVGNARRIAGDLFGAERALQSGLDLLDTGTGSTSERAEAMSLLASLRIDQSRFADAISLLEKVVATYRSLDERRLEGRTLILLGNAAGYSGAPLRAVELLRPAIKLLMEVGDDHAALLAKANVAYFLADAGRFQEAEAHLETLRSEYDRFPEDRSTQIRRRWLEGRIHDGLGDLDEAAATLREVRNVFAEEERAYDNALVTLDLAAVYLQAGKIDEVKRLAEELYPVFRSHDVHRHAVAALILFEQAAATEAATVALVRDLSRYLTRARNNPSLEYEPGATSS